MKDEEGFYRPGAIDPGVQATLSTGRPQHQPAQRLTPKQRKRQAQQQAKEKARADLKAAKEKAKATERKDRRVGYDLTPELKARIAETADAAGTTASQLVMLGMSLFLQQLEAGQINLSDYLKFSNSKRYGYNVKLPDITPKVADRVDPIKKKGTTPNNRKG